MYTGKEDSLTLKDVGISVFFPAARCEKYINISIEVVNDTSTLLMPVVSALYHITASSALPVPVRVRIQHCAVVPEEKKDTLQFMVAHGEPPYHFVPLSGGIFQESYGEISLTEFSILTIIQNIRDWNMRFSVHVYRCNDDTVDFVVTKNIPQYRTAVQKEYLNAKKIFEVAIVCSFLTTEIALNIPDSEGDGWKVTPAAEPPRISMDTIHAYRTGTTLPNIKMNVKWEGQGEPGEKTVNIGVQGGDYTSFNMVCKPTTLTQSPISGCSAQPVSQPTLPLLLRFPTRSGGSFNIIERIETKNHNLGIRLLDDATGAITGNIEAHYKNDLPTRTTEAILKKWLEGTGRIPRTWATLVTVLREIELNALAKEIEDNLVH